MDKSQRRLTRISALAYTLISVAVALAFFLVASGLDNHSAVAIYGGTAWVFLLSMIITMPTVTPWIKRHLSS